MNSVLTNLAPFKSNLSVLSKCMFYIQLVFILFLSCISMVILAISALFFELADIIDRVISNINNKLHKKYQENND